MANVSALTRTTFIGLYLYLCLSIFIIVWMCLTVQMWRIRNEKIIWQLSLKRHECFPLTFALLGGYKYWFYISEDAAHKRTQLEPYESELEITLNMKQLEFTLQEGQESFAMLFGMLSLNMNIKPESMNPSESLIQQISEYFFNSESGLTVESLF